MLKPATLAIRARTVPRCFLTKEKYFCSIRVDCNHASLSVRLCPVKSIPVLLLRNSAILSGVRASKFSIRIRIHLAWWQTRTFQDHSVLETIPDFRIILGLENADGP